MCGRFFLTEPDYKKLASHYGVDIDNTIDFRPNYNAAPSQILPVVTNEHQKLIEPLRWGYIPVWSKDKNIGYKLINTRAETAFDKPMWKGAIRHHRCIVPASGFYE